MKSQLYTGTGDAGITSLVGGERVKKNSLRLESYGMVDELSSQLGVVASDPECNNEVRAQLTDIQNELFNIGAYLATAVKPGETPGCVSVDNQKLKVLEGWIDALDEQTPKIRAFVLPGGSKIAAQCHVARTVCRRTERAILALSDAEYVDPAVLTYFNRLSDYLFIAARFLNFMLGIDEVVWKK